MYVDDMETEPPRIIRHPEHILSRYGDEEVNFTVSAVGSKPLTYQWMKDGKFISDDKEFSGTHSPTLHIHFFLPGMKDNTTVLSAIGLVGWNRMWPLLHFQVGQLLNILHKVLVTHIFELSIIVLLTLYKLI